MNNVKISGTMVTLPALNKERDFLIAYQSNDDVFHFVISIKNINYSQSEYSDMFIKGRQVNIEGQLVVDGGITMIVADRLTFGNTPL